MGDANPRKNKQKPAKKAVQRAEEARKPTRTAEGTYAPGQSGNPGGLPKEARELRRAFLERSEKALKLVDAWLDGEEFKEQRFAVQVVLERSLGMPGKSSDLPDLTPPGPEPEQNDTGTLIERVRLMLSRAVEGLGRRQRAGDFGLEDVATLGKLGHSLAELQKAEREAQRASEGRGDSLEVVVKTYKEKDT